MASIDVLTRCLANNYTNLVALGLSEVTVDGTTITFKLNDGTQASVTLPTPADGKDGKNGTDGSDGRNIEYTWSGTKLGIRYEGTDQFAYVDLKGDTGNMGKTGAAGNDGAPGAAGKSAYEIAVDNGYTGTEQQWLNSLKATATMEGAASEISNATLKGNIIPDLGDTYSIGTAEKKLKAIYADEVYMSSNTLYINGVPVFHTDNSDDLMFTADADQSIKVKTTGDATTNILSEQDVDIRTSKEASNINISAGDVSTGTSSNANINASNNINIIANNQVTTKAPNVNFEGAVAIKGGANVDNLTVTGDLNILGNTTQVDTQNLNVKDNMITINDGESGTGVTAGSAGIKIDRGDSADYVIEFDEIDDMFKIGAVNQLETIATHEYVDEAIAASSTDVDLTGYVKEDDFTTALNGYVSNISLNTKLGDYVSTYDLNSTILPEYAKISSLHSHSNKSVLDKFSEGNDGNVLYNGKVISGGSEENGDGGLSRTETVLWQGKVNNGTLELSDDINNYQTIQIVACDGTDGYNYTPEYSIESIVESNNNKYGILYTIYGTNHYWFKINENILTLTLVGNIGSYNIVKVIGINYTSKGSANLSTYSTNEQVVGTWIDGKPIYRQVFTGTVASTSASLFTIDSAKLVTDVKGVMISSTNEQFPINFTQSGSTQRIVFFNGTSMQYRGSDSAQQTYYITVEYTKTTD